MSRTPKKSFSKTHNVTARKDYIDYDYLNQLSDNDKKWLAKFTDEYYGADFTINDSYAKKEDLVKVLSRLALNEKNDTKRVKFKKQLNYISNQSSEYIKLNNNDNKKLDIDLRRLRKINIYYLINNQYVTDKNQKYTDNIHPISYLKDCNHNANVISRDMMSVNSTTELVDDHDNNVFLDKIESEVKRPDEIIEEMEEERLNFYTSLNNTKSM